MPMRNPGPSSGNVFADLNLPRADDLLTKAELAAKIIAEIQRRRLTQAQAAAILGVDQPKISALKQGKLSGFSIERLIRFLVLLGRDVEIIVKTRPRSRALDVRRVLVPPVQTCSSFTRETCAVREGRPTPDQNLAS